jgi:hypothetical protein
MIRLLVTVLLAASAVGCSRVVRVIHLEPDWRTEYRLGIEAFKRKDYRPAEDHFLHALQRHPVQSKDYRPDLYLAKIYFAERRFEKAMAAVTKTLSMGLVSASDPERRELDYIQRQIKAEIERTAANQQSSAPANPALPPGEGPPKSQPAPPSIETPPPTSGSDELLRQEVESLAVEADFWLNHRTVPEPLRRQLDGAWAAASSGPPDPKSIEVLRRVLEQIAVAVAALRKQTLAPGTLSPLSAPTTAPRGAPPGGVESEPLNPKPEPGASALPPFISIPGPVQVASGPGQATPATTFQWVLLGIGVLLVLVAVTAAVFIPNPTTFQHSVFRTVLALSVSLSAASIPWFVGTPSGVMQTAGVAASALSLFLLVFLFDPVRRARGTDGRHAGVLTVSPAGTRSIFVSYRRSDTADIVGRLYEHLVQRFGKEAVFKDVDTLTPGLDFREELSAALAQCQIVLAVIGPNWQELLTAQHDQRPEDEHDFVVLEIASALTRRIPVIPVLVQQATLPESSVLPASLVSLRYRQSLPLRSDPDFATDMDRLMAAIEELLARALMLSRRD